MGSAEGGIVVADCPTATGRPPSAPGAGCPQSASGGRSFRSRPGPRSLGPLLVALGMLACRAEGPPERRAEPVVGTAGDSRSSPALADRSSRGMVVSGSVPATQAGAEILAMGGNAVDAAVATAFALAVAEPTQSGLGGRTQALVRTPDGAFSGVDATTEVPGSYPTGAAPSGEFGWAAVGIPGTVRGLGSLHAAHGQLPWEVVVAPAIRLADEGFALSEGEAERIASAAAEFAADPGARAHFRRPDGTSYDPGSRLVQPALGRTLRQIARGGADAFYDGEIARALAREMAANKGFVTEEDLAAYEARQSIVVRGRYRGLDLAGTYLPASGGTTIEALQILEHFDLSSMDSAARIAVVSQALLLAFQDREDAAGPASDDARRLTSSEWARQRSTAITLPTAQPAGLIGDPHTYPDRPRQWTGSSRIQAGQAILEKQSAGHPPYAESAHTTHLSVVDAEGMAVSMTQSLGPTGGARVASLELGFLLASTMGYLADARPGDRPWSSQSPLIIERDSRLAYVLGGAGARRIISALVETVVGLVDDGLPLGEALSAPRFHPSEGVVYLESTPNGVTIEGRQALQAVGLEGKSREPGTYFARLNLIARDGETGELTGAADPRWPWSGASGPRER
jgi:gamma-glutamyltranspeptidase/glutathione hydrolase